MESVDGINWTPRPTTNTAQLYSLAYNGTLVVAVGASGFYYSSDDGATWTFASKPYWILKSVSYGNGVFVAVAEQEKYYYSSDGINWTEGTLPSNNRWSCTAFGSNNFVITSYDGTNRSAYSSAGTGVDQTVLTFSDDENLDLFTAAEAVVQNSSGTPVTSAITVVGTISGDWTLAANNIGATCVTYGNGTFVAGSNINPRIIYSFDGVTWNTATENAPSDVIDVAFGNNSFVAVSSGGSDQFLYSPNGITWTEMDSPGGYSTWSGVCYGSDKWVAVRTGGGTEVVAYSPDGLTWYNTTAANGISSGDSLRDVAYGNGVYAIVGDYRGIYSSDGINWSDATGLGGSNWAGVAYGNGMFVAVGYGGNYRTAYSYDGINWNIVVGSNIADNVWKSVAYNNGLFVAVAQDGRSDQGMYTYDGINWVAFSPLDLDLHGVTYGGDRWVAVGMGNDNIMWSYTGTGADQIGLTLTNNTNLANLRTGDAVTETGGDGTGSIRSISATSVVLSEPTGNWNTGSTVTGPVLTGSGTLTGVSGTTLSLSNSNGRWLVTEDDYETNKKLNKKAKQFEVPVDGTKKYLKFDSFGNVETLLDTPQSPAYKTTDEDPTLTLKFPATFPSGFTPDEELSEGVTLTVEATATNVLGSDGPKSDTVQPSVETIQFNEPLLNVLDDGWTSESGVSNKKVWKGVAYGGGKLVAVAEDFSDDKPQVMHSSDGINWTSANAARDTEVFRSVAYANGKFMAVGGEIGLPMYSTNGGVNWTSGNATTYIDLQSVAYVSPYWVAVGSYYGNNYSQRVMWSDDGDLWEHYQGTNIDTEAADDKDWYSITSANGKYVAVGNNCVMWSNNATNWNAASASEANIWRSVTYGNGRYVAVADNGINQVMYSDDGALTWTSASAASDSRWTAVTYGDGKFVAVAREGTNRVMWSDDGINWISGSASEDNSWYAVTYADFGKFVAVASDGTNQVMWSNEGTADGLEFNDGTDTTTISPEDVVNQGTTAGKVVAVVDNKLYFSSASGTWTTEANGGSNVIGPEKIPISSLTTEELEEQKLKFLTYYNRKEVVCGEEASAARAALQATLIEAGYEAADIAQAYSNLDN